MTGGVVVVHRDTDYLSTGTHKGSTSVTITDIGKDFKSCGVYAALAVYNDTDSTNGLVVSVTENTVTTDITFHNGDTYIIYKTGTYNSVISKHYTDRRFGDKVTKKTELIDGIKPKDRDWDEHRKNVFGPGQPMRD